MGSWAVLIVSWAYLLGLLSTGIAGGEAWLPLIGSGWLLGGIVFGLVVPRLWRQGPTAQQWVLAGMAGAIATLYCTWRQPRPSVDDISRFAPAAGQSAEVHVVGQVEQMPQTTRSQKGKFLVSAYSLRQAADAAMPSKPSQVVSGKLYVTAPLKPSQQLYPGQFVELKGQLYLPQPAEASDDFDFGAYLAKQGCFAGLGVRWITDRSTQPPPPWALWRLRQRLVAAQSRWLGESEGALVSAMTLGRRAVDLPYDLRDAFIAAGLAHTLAASGFHVSLVLGLVLGAVRSRPPKVQALIGLSALLVYVGLTGLQPSVMRAAVMGAGALAGLALERQVKPLGCLLLAVSLLLVWNPHWIWDVGFQLSVMATLGLIVTVPALAKRLDGLPSAIATVISVPLAACLWTLPLQLYYFGVLPSYSILLNIVVTPLIVLIATGGFISAMAAIVWPLLGSAIASTLYYPVRLLIALIDFFNQLPGHTFTVEHFSVLAVFLTYGLYGLIYLGLRLREQADSAAWGR